MRPAPNFLLLDVFREDFAKLACGSLRIMSIDDSIEVFKSVAQPLSKLIMAVLTVPGMG
jgi:hypothetical protein